MLEYWTTEDNDSSAYFISQCFNATSQVEGGSEKRLITRMKIQDDQAWLDLQLNAESHESPKLPEHKWLFTYHVINISQICQIATKVEHTDNQVETPLRGMLTPPNSNTEDTNAEMTVND